MSAFVKGISRPTKIRGDRYTPLSKMGKVSPQTMQEQVEVDLHMANFGRIQNSIISHASFHTPHPKHQKPIANPVFGCEFYHFGLGAVRLLAQV